MSKKGERISEEKAKRIAVGATVGGVLLIIFLIVILVVQFVQIGVANSKKAYLDEQIIEYEKLEQQAKNNLEYYKTGKGLYWYARQNGFK